MTVSVTEAVDRLVTVLVLGRFVFVATVVTVVGSVVVLKTEVVTVDGARHFVFVVVWVTVSRLTDVVVNVSVVLTVVVLHLMDTAVVVTSLTTDTVSVVGCVTVLVTRLYRYLYFVVGVVTMSRLLTVRVWVSVVDTEVVFSSDLYFVQVVVTVL